MGWNFTIHDFTTGSEVVTTIDEPIGWDAFNLHLKRDEKAHGFFGFEDDTFSSMQFFDDGGAILRNAYYNYGVQGDVKLGIAYACEDGAAADNIFLGRFDFTTFKDYTGDFCYVECATFVSESYMQFNNRRGQQVDLDSLASYDQEPESQTVTTNAIFDGATNQIRVTQLLNGIMPGSKITIVGSSQDGSYTVASAKPDYTTVNADLASGSTLATSITVSATFDPDNKTISINQLINLTVGDVIGLTTPTWPSGSIPHPDYDNSGFYTVGSVQQFFNYTVVTISAVNITSTTALNGSTVSPPHGYMAPISLDTVVISSINGTASIVYTSQPTSTIIQVAESIMNEATVSITLTGSWLKNNMVPYAGLAKIITMPAKEIVARSVWRNNQELICNLNMGNPKTAVSIEATSFITPNMPNVVSDIDETDAGTGYAYTPVSSHGGFDTSNTPDTLIYFRPGSLACTGLARIKFSISFAYIPYDSGDTQTYIIGMGSYRTANFVINKGSDPTHITGSVLTSVNINRVTFPMPLVTITGELDNINFEPGEYLWAYFEIPVTNTSSAYYPKLLIGAGSYIDFSIKSQCTDTPCSVYMVNEALSRCVESYTNNEIQVYSDYFGRTNAQPVASTDDGCGALEAITNGLRIRGCVMPDSTSIPKFFTSFDDMFTALDAIHNIGHGLETDPHRSGKQRLRVEPFEFFFQNTVMLTCSGIKQYKRETVTNLLASTFKVGYQQYETWNNNGLYDIFGNRTYRTPLNHLVNEIDKTCKWLASDYAIEFTRRQFGLTSSDSRYDDNTFILCLAKNVPQLVTFFGPGSIVSEGNCVVIANTLDIQINATIGTTVAITGTAANDFATYSIVTAEIYGAFMYMTLSGAAISYGYEPTAKLVIGSYTVNNTPAVFISGGGGLALSTPVYGLSVGDGINITGTTSNNGNKTVYELFYPQDATNIPGELAFPMYIFATTSFIGEIAFHAVITDTSKALYIVEQGMKNGTNILSPSTVMNYRISPAHNAMRHYRNIITDRQYASESLIFTGGEGNFYALGKMDDACSPENDNISEGGNLSLANFSDSNDGKPLFYPEVVTYDYPLAWSDFLDILDNPYRIIKYQHAIEGLKDGYLVDLQYKPNEGMASFILYPKIS